MSKLTKDQYRVTRVYLRLVATAAEDGEDDIWTMASRNDPYAVVFEATTERFKKYYLKRWIGPVIEYYASGADHGWHKDPEKATLYSEESFAIRDWGSMPATIRPRVSIEHAFVDY